MSILVIGELNPDLILKGYQTFPVPGREVVVDDMHLSLGSSSAICAHGLARLGNSVSLLSKVGCDHWGDYCLMVLQQAGVGTSLVLRDPHVKTGLTVSISGTSDRALVTYLGAIAALQPEEIDSDVFSGYRHLHVSSFYLQQGLQHALPLLFQQARQAGLSTSLDPGGDPANQYNTEVLLRVLPHCQLFLPSESELAGVTGKILTEEGLRALSHLPTHTVVKLGKRGCLTLVDGQPLAVPALSIQPVDATGAGDSFNAGFLHAWLGGEPLEQALRFATTCGSLSTRQLGGVSAQPTAVEASARMRTELVGEQRA